MTDESNDILFSQLADGELDADRADALLLDVLDDAAERERLKAMLRLRQSTAGWRTAQPARPVLVVAPRAVSSRGRTAWHAGALAMAACVGGILVLVGVWAAGWLGGAGRGTPAAVTADQMQQVANVFAFHESVAGPLAWYAADDRNVRLASAQGSEGGQRPIAVLLKLAPEGEGAAARTLVIVCREDQPTVFELPAESPDRAGLRVYLAPRTVNGTVDVRYAIAVDGDTTQPAEASLTGRRRVGLTETSLGQLALGDQTLNVEAAAWPMPEERK